MTKHLLKQLIFLLCLVGLIGGGGWFLLNTEPGLRADFYLLSKIVPGKLSAQKINGKLLDKVTITELRFVDKTRLISAGQVEIKWEPKDLLIGKLTLNALHADEVKIKIDTSDTPVMGFGALVAAWEKFKVPGHFAVQDLVLNNISWQIDKQPSQVINKISLESQLAANKNLTLKAEVQAKDAELLLQGSVQKVWDLSWRLHLSTLHQFVPNFNGQIDCVGKVMGQLQNPIIDAKINLADFKGDGYGVKQFHGSIWFDLAQQQKSNFNFSLLALRVGSIYSDKINIVGSIDAIKAKSESVAFIIKLAATKIFFGSDAKQFIKLEPSEIVGSLGKLGLASKATLNLAQFNAINLELQLPKLQTLTQFSLAQPIQGQLTWQVQNLGFIQALLPKVTNLHGNLQIKYKLAGSLQHLDYVGDAILNNASFTIPELNLNLQNINLQAKHVKNTVNYQGVIHSGNGNVNLSGATVIAANNITSKVNLQGNNFLVVNTPEYKIIAAPQLLLQAKNNSYVLTGKVFIPEASLKPKDSSGSSLPPEVVFTNKAKPKEEAIIPLTTKIQLDLGENITFDVMDLKGKVTGHLQLNDEPKKMATAIGSLYIKNGTYSLYGQQLQVTSGTLQFLGGVVTNPIMNAQAVRDFSAVKSGFGFGSLEQSLQVGIKMSGSLDNLHIDLFSIPSGLSKSDILSYLVIGQPSDQASGAKAQLLLQAASSLNFGGASDIKNLINKLQQKLGLSEFGFGSETHFAKPLQIDPTKLGRETKPGEALTTNTAFVLGKFLTPRIYIGYSMGLLDPVSIFRVKYFMGHHWSIQTETSTLGNGGDLLYTYESN